MKKFAIIGFGGLGKLHFQNLIKIQDERKDIALVAICNDKLDEIKKTATTNISSVSLENVDFSKYNLYDDYKKMIQNEDLDFVVIALPTFLHSEVATYCLEKNIHVYSEKPMALSLVECSRMNEAAKKHGCQLMVGQCLRFTDEYMYIKKLIDTNEYGKVVKAEFLRKSPLPLWSAGGWLLDESKSGGIIVDFHIHDVDIINWYFGKPEKIHSISNHKEKNYASIYTLYDYGDKKVIAIADWGLPAKFSFVASYKITFENAYVESVNGDITVYTNEEIFKPELEKGDCYYREMCEFIDCVVNEKTLVTATLDSVYSTMEILFEEKQIVQK